MDALASADSPIAALTEVTRVKLSLMLNGRKILPSDEGFPRDWRGLAQCLCCDNDEVQALGRTASPAAALLERHKAMPVSSLWSALTAIGRLDVQDDARHMIEVDVARYQERLSSSVPSSTPVTSNSVLSDENLLCVGDAECLRTGQPLPTFDAFLLYDDKDSEFGAQIIERMEARGIKLCDKERHLLPGVTFEHQGIIRLMETRCHRVLAVLSPQFLQSAVNKFLAMFAQALGLEKQGRMLLPCVYQKCTLPSYLMFCSRIDFTRGIGLVNAWDKMYETLSMSMVNRPRSISYSATERRQVPDVSKSRSDSTPSSMSLPAAPPPPPAGEQQDGAGRGLLSRLRGRLRTSEGSESVPHDTPPHEPEKRGQLAKIFSHKDKQKKAKSEKKKKAAKVLVSA